MEFSVMLMIIILLSAGIIILATPLGSGFLRLSDTRKASTKKLMAALRQAAAVAGKKAFGLRTAKKREAVDKELFSALSILRNYASAGENDGKAVTSDQILEQFAQADGVMKEAYEGALRFLRTGRKIEAAEYFAATAGTELARDVIMLILDWDSLPPYKLKKTVLAFQSALKETRTTELIQKNEILSDLVYLPVVVGVLVIFVNFIYIAYFNEQRELLTELFY